MIVSLNFSDSEWVALLTSLDEPENIFVFDNKALLENWVDSMKSSALNRILDEENIFDASNLPLEERSCVISKFVVLIW